MSYSKSNTFGIIDDPSDTTNYSKPDKFGRELVSYCSTFNEVVIDLSYGDKNDGHCFTNVMDFTSYRLYRGSSLQFINGVDQGIKEVCNKYPNCKKEALWNRIASSDN